ncbi:thermonuclease family protein [Nostoc sp. MG11]|uniref:thermonuclease family protein n=1 Tax=Nostoc sp. MG11 TaxID=2721166 RepID=UPI0018665329|nr:thermonuclease family protein [Nostoc sp. MG11]
MEKSTKQVQFWLCATIILLGLIGCDRLVGNSGNVVERVSDGDTLVVRDTNGQNVTVRFACVDAPEVAHSNREKQSRRTSDRNQFTWGVRAQERVRELVRQGGDRVNLNITDSDRYGRQVAEVRLRDGTLVQEVLVQEGLAKVYRPYLNKCPSRTLVQQAEGEARQQRLGVWGDSRFVNPWEYRSFNKIQK